MLFLSTESPPSFADSDSDVEEQAAAKMAAGFKYVVLILEVIYVLKNILYQHEEFLGGLN